MSSQVEGQEPAGSPGSETNAPEASEAVDPIIVGTRLRDYRKRAGMTLKDVCSKAQLSEGFLSLLERGMTNASVSSLQRITEVLGITVAELYGSRFESQPVRLMRRHERPALAFGNLGRKYLLTPGQQEHLEIFQVSFEPNGSTGDEPYSHGSSHEVIFVMAGTFEVQVNSETYLLGVGDNLQFNSASPHRVVNVGDRPGEIMWTISPPSY